ncbi:MAG: thioredoxin family protein [Candidatus Marinimicrobia bacterium]|nr:thioredoxin family protein [Candidatus Neomarinimicrobiota bacterium]
MRIQILGTGCVKCELLMERTREALQQLGSDTEPIKVSDINEILDFGIMTIPALVIGGNVPPVHELKEIIKKG